MLNDVINQNSNIKPNSFNVANKMEHLIAKLKIIFASKKRVWLLGTSVAIILLFGLMFLLKPNANSTKAYAVSDHKIDFRREQLLNHLTKIEKRLEILSQKQDHGQNPTDAEMQTITTQLNQLQTEMNGLHSKNNAPEIIAAVNMSKETLTKALTALQGQVESLQAQVHPIHYLPTTALPFSVQGIDVWNGVPKATVKIAGESALMAQNDARSGWTLAQLNFYSREALFVNAKQDYVKVSLLG